MSERRRNILAADGVWSLPVPDGIFTLHQASDATRANVGEFIYAVEDLLNLVVCLKRPVYYIVYIIVLSTIVCHVFMRNTHTYMHTRNIFIMSFFRRCNSLNQTTICHLYIVLNVLISASSICLEFFFSKYSSISFPSFFCLPVFLLHPCQWQHSHDDSALAMQFDKDCFWRARGAIERPS